MTVKLEREVACFMRLGEGLGRVIQTVAGRRKNWLSLGAEGRIQNENRIEQRKILKKEKPLFPRLIPIATPRHNP